MQLVAKMERKKYFFKEGKGAGGYKLVWQVFMKS